jgi:ABC-2 type transport system ATP-binding protein
LSGRSLEIRALHKTYGHKTYGQVVALDDMDFQVHAGEMFGFVGGNGAGKTTTMRIVLGVLAPDEGEVRWDGRPLTLDIRRRFGAMPEERGLYPRMRVGEQLVYLARLRGMTRAAARASTEYWTERLGVAARRDDEVQKLSLGNQQRVQLAASLVHDPEVLVLDEPFSGLDPVAVDVMSDVLRERCARGAAVMFSSHQLELVERLCDRVGIVAGGRMVACDSVPALRARGTGDRGVVQLLVDAPDAPPGWSDGLPGVRVRSRDGAVTILDLDAGADDQAVLAAALATGPVHAFTRRLPTLADLFRGVVADAPPADAPPADAPPADASSPGA